MQIHQPNHITGQQIQITFSRNQTAPHDFLLLCLLRRAGLKALGMLRLFLHTKMVSITTSKFSHKALFESLSQKRGGGKKSAFQNYTQSVAGGKTAKGNNKTPLRHSVCVCVCVLDLSLGYKKHSRYAVRKRSDAQETDFVPEGFFVEF